MNTLQIMGVVLGTLFAILSVLMIRLAFAAWDSREHDAMTADRYDGKKYLWLRFKYIWISVMLFISVWLTIGFWALPILL